MPGCILKDWPILFFWKSWWWQYHRQVRNRLNDNYTECWVGKYAHVVWPTRSPDLTPLDFLWRTSKAILPGSREDLIALFQVCCQLISPGQINSTRSVFQRYRSRTTAQLSSFFRACLQAGKIETLLCEQKNYWLDLLVLWHFFKQWL